MRKAAAAGAFVLAVVVAPSAHALEESTRGPFYIQGLFGSASAWTGFPFGGSSGVYWHPEIEFGVHFTGRQDGVVLGLRQSFDVASRFPLGETVIRGGYDLAFPLRNGRFEITLSPYLTLGLNYFFDGPNAGVHFAAGFEAKFIFWHGLHILARPIELSAGEFVNLGPFYKNVFFNLNGGVGAGYAF